MKVGEYVRTKVFGIRKITFIDEIALECGEYSFETDISIPGFCDFSGEDIIGKPSSKIKDLIQVGDYVNGEKITRIVPPDLCGDEELTDKKVYINDFEVYEEWIKSIVTHEQFSQMEYRIGE